MECYQIREYLPAFDEQADDAAVREHLQDCESCRAQLKQYRDLGRELSALAGYDLVPPAGLEAAIIEATLERLRRTAALRAASRQLGEHRGVAAGGALLLAGVAGAILFNARQRKQRVEVAAPPPAAA